MNEKQNDFEFRDAYTRQYLVHFFESGATWLCYKHPDGQYVTLRPIKDDAELELCRALADGRLYYLPDGWDD